MAESPGALNDTWGWYQDAGDWDSYETHLRVAQELLLVYFMAPGNFRDGELNIPESGNGIPDLLDEAAWLPRFCHRLRHELIAKKWGTGGLGLRVAGDAFGSDEGTTADGKKVGRGSWEDTDRTWMVSGEDPWSTYRYAGAAANLALAIPRDPEGVDWAREARECYAWARANTRPGDEERNGGRLRPLRAYAAASLFALTGEKAHEEQFARDTQGIDPGTYIWDEQQRYGPAVYALNGKGDAATVKRITGALFHTADEELITTPSKRALRWGGNFSMPMLVGQQTTPLVLDGAVGYTLARRTDPERARKYLAALYTTCDYFLGTNALNQTWMTGVGPRSPTEIFHMDAWYNGKGKYHEGLIPYSPWRKSKDQGQGPWDVDWANATAYPHIDQWPGNERWFSNRCSPMGSEFTVHQNIGPAAAIYGFLCAAPRRRDLCPARRTTEVGDLGDRPLSGCPCEEQSTVPSTVCQARGCPDLPRVASLRRTTAPVRRSAAASWMETPLASPRARPKASPWSRAGTARWPARRPACKAGSTPARSRSQGPVRVRRTSDNPADRRT